MKSILIKGLLVIAGLVLFIHGGSVVAQLSAETRSRVDTAAIVLSHLMDKQWVSAQEFVDLLTPFKKKYASNEQKLELIEAVKDATLDTHFGVENFDECTVYYDGCNECYKAQGEYEMACTERACIQHDTPRCESYESQDDEQPGELSTLCEDAGGTWLPEHQECEYVSEAFCTDYGGEFNECGSACRNDPDADICTLQCVPFCSFGVPDEPVSNEDKDYTTTQEALEIAQVRWETEMTDNTYAAEQEISCFCVDDYRRPISFYVENGQVDMDTAMYSDEEGGELGEHAPELLTVEEMFAMIQEAIDSNVDEITVEYDDELGYPTSVWIDVSTMMADEEKSYTYEVVVQ